MRFVFFIVFYFMLGVNSFFAVAEDASCNHIDPRKNPLSQFDIQLLQPKLTELARQFAFRGGNGQWVCVCSYPVPR